MLIAAMGDIHGNLPALEAVLREIDEMGVQTIVNTGDCVVGHPWPNEVIDLLRSRGVATVQGEWDRIAARFERKKARIEREIPAEDLAAIRETYEATHSRNLEFLAALPRELHLTVDGITVCVCHGTPQGQGDALHENDEIGKYRRRREVANADIIVCGRTHVPFSRSVDNTLFVNPGAVGISADGGRVAQYATISTEAAPWEAQTHSVPY